MVRTSEDTDFDACVREVLGLVLLSESTATGIEIDFGVRAHEATDDAGEDVHEPKHPIVIER